LLPLARAGGVAFPFQEEDTMAFIRTPLACGIALAFAHAAPVFAADSDIEAIRNEIKQIKDSYETRIQALEQRLKDAEVKAEKAQAAQPVPAKEAASAASQPTAAPQRARPTNNAFNPAISLILDAKYQHLQRDPKTYRIGGFIPGGDEIGPGERSFNLGESELNLSANIDNYLYGGFTAAIAPANEVAVEEAYFSTLNLPAGLTLKAGRFFSGVGYLNEQHAHAWDFADAPLAYQAFFAPQLKQDGVQLRWVAPAPIFLEFGAELASGKVFPGSAHGRNGLRGQALFAHAGGDAGVSNSWRAGVSFVRAKPKRREFEDVDSTDTDVLNAFSGDSKTYGLDFIWKWAPNGDATQRNFKFQAEYFRRKEDGTLTTNSAAGACGGDCSGNYDSTQHGFYAQGVFQFMPRWRVGLRFDQLKADSPGIGLIDDGTLAAEDFGALAAHKPKRYGAMIDFSLSEFSRFRLQLAKDQARFDESDNQIFLQYILTLGAHGAHKF
jgi:hypothetical protein